MHKIITEQENCGESIEQFCRSRGLVVSTFENWRRRVLAPVPKPDTGFVQLAATESKSTRDVILQVGDMTVRCPSDLGVSAIAELARALRT